MDLPHTPTKNDIFGRDQQTTKVTYTTTTVHNQVLPKSSTPHRLDHVMGSWDSLWRMANRPRSLPGETAVYLVGILWYDDRIMGLSWYDDGIMIMSGYEN